MGKVLPFPRAVRPRHGIIHVSPCENGRFEIAHESGSGNSWDGFQQFPCAEAAIFAAYALNKEAYGGECEVSLHPSVLEAAGW